MKIGDKVILKEFPLAGVGVVEKIQHGKTSLHGRRKKFYYVVFPRTVDGKCAANQRYAVLSPPFFFMKYEGSDDIEVLINRTKGEKQ